eukprot:scaffold669540_cov66-Prasinocladus_malaysianus.AAC.1
MQQWKQGVTDVLAGARQEVLSASVQPLEEKVGEINTVLSVSLGPEHVDQGIAVQGIAARDDGPSRYA